MNKRAVIAAAVAVPVVAAAELVVLGAKGGIGPLKFLKDRKMAKLPGNNAMYHPQYINTEGCAESPLRGKRVLFLGSSVTAGTASLGVSMADYLGLQDGCEVVKEAAPGTTLADLDGMSYLARLKKLDPAQHFDAIVVQLSTNDARRGVPGGELAFSRDPRVFDTKTTLGALEAVAAYCQAIWGCPLFVYTGTKFENEGYQALVDALPAFAEKWDACVIDLWNDPEMNAVSASDYNYYMADPIHPTQAGYLLWWTPKFREALKHALA